MIVLLDVIATIIINRYVLHALLESTVRLEQLSANDANLGNIRLTPMVVCVSLVFLDYSQI